MNQSTQAMIVLFAPVIVLILVIVLDQIWSRRK
jgi:hypothetical protein